MTFRQTAPRALAPIALLALVSCGPLSGLSGGHAGPAGPLAHGDFQAAVAALRDRAASCQNGERGRQAVLLWTALELDPRNTRGSPRTAAGLAARYLQLPDARPAGVSTAEALYLLALDRGASPVEDPWSFRQVAPRFSHCDEPSPEPRVLRQLPEHPGTPSWRALRRSRAQADSLESELERIRRLLQDGDGGRLP